MASVMGGPVEAIWLDLCFYIYSLIFVKINAATKRHNSIKQMALIKASFKSKWFNSLEVKKICSLFSFFYVNNFLYHRSSGTTDNTHCNCNRILCYVLIIPMLYNIMIFSQVPLWLWSAIVTSNVSFCNVVLYHVIWWHVTWCIPNFLCCIVQSNVICFKPYFISCCGWYLHLLTYIDYEVLSDVISILWYEYNN